MTLGVGATGYVGLTVEVCGYKICIESGTGKICKSDASIRNDKIHH